MQSIFLHAEKLQKNQFNVQMKKRQLLSKFIFICLLIYTKNTSYLHQK